MSTTTALPSRLFFGSGTAGDVYNVGGEEHENLTLTHRILELTGANADLIRHVDDRPGHDRRYSLDDSKLRELGWSPTRSIAEPGLAETVDWYRDNRAWWAPIKSGAYRDYYEQQYATRLRASPSKQAYGFGCRTFEQEIGLHTFFTTVEASYQ